MPPSCNCTEKNDPFCEWYPDLSQVGAINNPGVDDRGFSTKIKNRNLTLILPSRVNIVRVLRIYAISIT